MERTVGHLLRRRAKGTLADALPGDRRAATELEDCPQRLIRAPGRLLFLEADDDGQSPLLQHGHKSSRANEHSSTQRHAQ